MSELNQIHSSIKSDYKFECKQIEFLDTLVYIDQRNKLQTTLSRKSSGRQNFLNAKSKHPYSLKKTIPYNTTFRIRQICSPFQEYHSHSRKLIEQFVSKGCKKLLSYSKFRRLTNSVESDCSINKSAVINNASLYK